MQLQQDRIARSLSMVITPKRVGAVFNVNFNVNFKIIFKTIQLCISW